jgi:phage regulator Rha-like protein
MVSSTSIYRWIEKYSGCWQKNQVLIVENKSETYRSKELEKQVKELEAALGRKQLEIDFLNKLIEQAGEVFKTDLKNFSTPSSNVSGLKNKPKATTK